ncbi:hypothetical protein KY290_017174 [Solanum tuberosum]|uniref:Uncharacterized protein n=1 Tax=Solanum tuberosum TaxID=4113 RepID=A0ABQ7VAT3_SOLTU|nr:hypothetical protein KY284_016205 [Solanum tuberosum]KAH0761101.1 hypothetical protein KY290_017174 [Solanum tuberosum]
MGLNEKEVSRHYKSEVTTTSGLEKGLRNFEDEGSVGLNEKEVSRHYKSEARTTSSLRNDFETLQMKEGESDTSYCARTMEISNKM